MDFFKYTFISDTILRMLTGTVDMRKSFVSGALLFAVLYIFQAVGLYTVAVRGGYKNKWMAFIPVLNTYYIGVCGQKNRFLKINTKIVSLIAAIAEGLLCVLCILYYVSYFQLDAANCIRIESVPEMYTGLYQVSAEVDASHVPSYLFWTIWYMTYYGIFVDIISIVYLFSLIITLSCFFQTYAARRYFLFAFTSILFPVRGILIFAVRKNKGMSYAEYVRSVQERMYRQYRNQQGNDPYNQNPYNQNPYNQNPYSNENNRQSYPEEPHTQSRSPEPEDPFSEFGSAKGNGGDPFDEFKN